LGGQIYSIGLYATLYLAHFERTKYNQIISQKQYLDPQWILNPLKLINPKIHYNRINTMFELNMFWRKCDVKINHARKQLKILEIIPKTDFHQLKGGDQSR
jgi:hypothetical protein